MRRLQTGQGGGDGHAQTDAWMTEVFSNVARQVVLELGALGRALCMKIVIFAGGCLLVTSVNDELVQPCPQ